jgi:multiple sugar transport system substrate-binding protein
VFTKKYSRGLAVVLTAGLAGAALAGCSHSTGSATTSSSSGSKVYTLWDPYTQYNSSSDWVKLVTQCGTQAGVTLKRSAFNTADLTNKALLAGQQKNAPDLLLIDNPEVSTLASSGMLTTTSTIGINTSQDQSNQLSAGVVNGKTYGVPIGANTLALFYNKTVLDKAGVNPASITTWAALTAALAKVKASGKTGITFSAVGTEEGSFTFLPWFWGAKGNLLNLDSASGVAALSLLTSWVKDGYAPNSVLNDTQTVAWQNFSTGDYGFTENNTSYQNAAVSSGLNYGIILIPGQNGGIAPTPTGGEFLTLPVQKDTSRYAVSKKIASCLTSTNNLVRTDTALSYISPTLAAQKIQVQKNPLLKVWATAVNNAKTRTGDNLGTKYPKISQPMWTAYQAALSGSSSPSTAMKNAQQQAASATK